MTIEKFRLIEEAVKQYKETLHERTWDVENNGWRWDTLKIQRLVVCVANRYHDFIVTGARHYCASMNLQIDAVGGIEVLREYANINGSERYEQGFIDQFCNFLTREEAYVIAEAAGQIRNPDHCKRQLFSEHLY